MILTMEPPNKKREIIMSDSWITNDTTTSFLDVLKYQFPRVAFYRPTMSTINFQCSISRQKFQIALATPIKDNSADKAIKSRNFLKDNVRFDYDNGLNFSLSMVEVYDLLANFNLILAGKYKTDNEKSPNTMILDHVINHQRMYIGSVPDKGSNNEPTIKLAVYNTQSKVSISYIFRRDHELPTFKNLLKHFYNDMPWMGILANSIVKTVRESMYEINKNPEKYNNNNSKKYNVPNTQPEQKTKSSPKSTVDVSEDMFDENGVFIVKDKNTETRQPSQEIEDETATVDIPDFNEDSDSDDVFGSNKTTNQVENDTDVMIDDGEDMFTF
jgi:hypothetical protein